MFRVFWYITHSNWFMFAALWFLKSRFEQALDMEEEKEGRKKENNEEIKKEGRRKKEEGREEEGSKEEEKKKETIISGQLDKNKCTSIEITKAEWPVWVISDNWLFWVRNFDSMDVLSNFSITKYYYR